MGAFGGVWWCVVAVFGLSGILTRPLTNGQMIEVSGEGAALLFHILGGGEFFERRVNSPPSPHIVTLSPEDLEIFIAKEPQSLILYFAPWCHWSQEMLNSYNAAADLLHHQMPNLRMAKLDASSSEELRLKHSIFAFPTLKIYLEGHEHEYTGGRYHSNIVKWVTEFFETEVTINSREHLNVTLELHKSDFVVIGGFDPTSSHTMNHRGTLALDSNTSDPHASNFIKLSRLYRQHMYFVDVSDLDIISVLKREHGLDSTVNVPFMAVINPYSSGKGAAVLGHPILEGMFAEERRIISFPGTLTDFDSAAQFLRFYQFPVVIPFEQRIISEVFSDGRPLFALVLDRTHPEATEHLKSIALAARRFRGRMLFIVSYLGEVFDTRLLNMIGAQHDALPTFRIFTVNPVGHQSWSPVLKFGASAELRASMDPQQIESFVDDYFADKLKPHLMSEPEPDPNSHGPVRQLVGLSFDREVKKSKNDIFVVFAAPWCGHCRKLEPTLLELGRKLRPVSTLVISKIDATRNEVPGLNIGGYPSLMLYRADRKDVDPQPYRGERSMEGIIRWLAENVKHTFDAEAILNDADGQDGDDDGLLEAEVPPESRGRMSGEL